MDNPLLVRGLQRFGDLRRNGEGLLDRDRPLRDPVGECRALDELHHQPSDAVRLFQAVNGRDVRVV